MTTKELKKLVKVCRDQGISHYKGPDFEFTLTQDAPIKQTAKQRAVETPYKEDPFESDSLTTEQLMFWSGAAEFEQEQSQIPS